MVLQASPPHNHQHHNTFQAQEIQIMIFTWSLLWFSKLIIITESTIADQISSKTEHTLHKHIAIMITSVNMQIHTSSPAPFTCCDDHLLWLL